MVYRNLRAEQDDGLGQGALVSLEKRIERCITVILYILILVNIGLWFIRVCFHTSSLLD